MTVTPNTNPVFNIKQGEYIAPIGTMGENVYINIGSTTTPAYITLQDFYNEWKSFKEQAKFIQYGENVPQSNSVKVWYQKPYVTDLTNTTWYFNEIINLDSQNDYEYDINFTWDTDSESSTFDIMSSIGKLQWNGGSFNAYSIEDGGWKTEECRTIYIIDGIHTDNVDLIDWLYNNAQRIG